MNDEMKHEVDELRDKDDAKEFSGTEKVSTTSVIEAMKSGANKEMNEDLKN